MPEITVSNLNQKTISTQDTTVSVLKALHENSIDWMHACGGKGRCTTCKMIVLNGLQNITPESDFEKKIRKGGILKVNERLACQSRVVGDIQIKVPEESKLPHVIYSE